MRLRDMHKQTLLQSFKCAGEGVAHLLKSERNFRIDVFFALLVIFVSFLLRIDAVQFLIILLCCALVLGLEGINSALEAAVDVACSEINPIAKKAKDMAAGAVLIGACFAVAIGLLIFVSQGLELLKSPFVIFHSQMPPLALSAAALVVYVGWVSVHPRSELEDTKGENTSCS